MNMVLIPRINQNSSYCLMAKQQELEKLKQFDSYTELQDVGQNRISIKRVLWMKGNETRARPVRGFEEHTDLQSDSRTITSAAISVFGHRC